MSAVYCSVCGGPLGINQPRVDLDDSYDWELISSQDEDWLVDLYPVDQTSFSDKPPNSRTISGASFHLRISDNAADWDPDTIGWANISEGDAGEAWYLMHKACILITEHIRRLRLFGDRIPASPKIVLDDFVETLRRLHYRIRNENGVVFDHGFYGARGFQSSDEWIECRSWEWLCVNPMSIPSLTPWVLSRLRALPTVRSDDADHHSPPYTTEAPRPALDGLPFDILTQIVSYLPIKSVLFLRRCNQSLASRINLDQCFWRNRLISGNLVDFLWDLDEAECRQKDLSGTGWDWRGLARDLRAQRFPEAALRRSLQTNNFHDEGRDEDREEMLDAMWKLADRAGDTNIEDAPLGLLNRCRIVRVVEELERIKEEEIRDSQIPLSKEENIYANMWIVAVSWPDKFDEWTIKRSLELYGSLHGVLNGL